MYTVEYSREALRTLMHMPRNVRELIRSKIEVIASNPLGWHAYVSRLQGRPEYRLRVQDWRVIYRLVDDRIVLLVIKIGARGQVYE
jgi:mRNA interferase RelE/StbE